MHFADTYVLRALFIFPDSYSQDGRLPGVLPTETEYKAYGYKRTSHSRCPQTSYKKCHTKMLTGFFKT